MTIFRNPYKVIHQPEYMMTISLQFHKLDSLQWPIAIVDYPARGQAPEIFAMRLNCFAGIKNQLIIKETLIESGADAKNSK